MRLQLIQTHQMKQQNKVSGEYKVTYKCKEGPQSRCYDTHLIPALAVVFEEAIAEVKQKQAESDSKR